MLGKVLSFSIGMSSKNIVNACEGVGKNLSAYIKAGKKVDLKALSSIYQKFTPQNNSVKLTSNVEKLREFLLKNKSSAEQADAFCSSLQACVVKLPKDDLFFVPIDKLSPRELVNISTHYF